MAEGESWTVIDSAVLSNTVPWRTFRWYKGQRHYSGMYWSATMRDHVVYESRLEPSRLIFARLPMRGHVIYKSRLELGRPRAPAAAEHIRGHEQECERSVAG